MSKPAEPKGLALSLDDLIRTDTRKKRPFEESQDGFTDGGFKHRKQAGSSKGNFGTIGGRGRGGRQAGGAVQGGRGSGRTGPSSKPRQSVFNRLTVADESAKPGPASNSAKVNKPVAAVGGPKQQLQKPQVQQAKPFSAAGQQKPAGTFQQPAAGRGSGRGTTTQPAPGRGAAVGAGRGSNIAPGRGAYLGGAGRGNDPAAGRGGVSGGRGSFGAGRGNVGGGRGNLNQPVHSQHQQQYPQQMQVQRAQAAQAQQALMQQQFMAQQQLMAQQQQLLMQQAQIHQLKQQQQQLHHQRQQEQQQLEQLKQQQKKVQQTTAVLSQQAVGVGQVARGESHPAGGQLTWGATQSRSQAAYTTQAVSSQEERPYKEERAYKRARGTSGQSSKPPKALDAVTPVIPTKDTTEYKKHQRCITDDATGDTVVQLYGQDLVRVKPNGEVTMDTGGIHTPATFNTLVETLSLLGVRIMSNLPDVKHFNWSLSDGRSLSRFYDGVTLPAKGQSTANRGKIVMQAFQHPNADIVLAATAASTAAAMRAGIFPTTTGATAMDRGGVSASAYRAARSTHYDDDDDDAYEDEDGDQDDDDFGLEYGGTQNNGNVSGRVYAGNAGSAGYGSAGDDGRRYVSDQARRLKAQGRWQGSMY